MSDSGAKTRLQRIMRGDDKMWVLLRCGMAEFIGSAVLILLACGGCIGTSLAGVPSHIQMTLNVGLTVMIVIQSIGHISHAHINPAMTLGAVILGKKNIIQGGVYFIAQYLGTIMGYGLLKLGTPAGMLRATPEGNETSFCITGLDDRVTPSQGLFLEFLATMILMLVAGAVWDDRNHRNTDSTPLKFGLTVTCLATVFGPYTGCSMNPARSFAPAIWNNNWRHQWIYWLGPFSGSAVGAFLYKMTYGVQEEKEEYEIAEAVALNHIDGEKCENV